MAKYKTSQFSAGAWLVLLAALQRYQLHEIDVICINVKGENEKICTPPLPAI